MEVNVFEAATRKKLRFSTSKGLVSTEELWDFSLEVLDRLAQDLNNQVKASEQQSFIKIRSSTDQKTKLAFDLVLAIITVKLAEKEVKEQEATKKAKRDQLVLLIEQKQSEQLGAKSLEELTKELASL